MAWVTGIKQAQMIQPERDGKEAIPPAVRVVTNLPLSAIAGTVRRGPMVFLPLHTGAGPCGTHARRTCAPSLIDPNKFVGQRFTNADRMPVTAGPSPIAWSIRHLIAPLQAYYAEKNKPRSPLSRAGITIGVKHGGGNGRAQLV